MGLFRLNSLFTAALLSLTAGSAGAHAAAPALPLAPKVKLAFASTGSQGADALARAVLEVAYGKLGYQIQFVSLPVRRAFTVVQAGDYDGISASGVLHVDKLIRVNVPVTYYEFMVYTRDMDFPVAGLASLKPYSVGIVAGARYFEETLRGIRLDPAPNLEALFKKLDLGRTDIVLESRMSLCIARRLGLDKIRVLEPPYESRMAYHYLGERHRGLAQQLERVLFDMDRDGSLKAIQAVAARRYVNQCH